MGVLRDLETFVVNTGQLREAGVPSVSIAFLDDPLSPVQQHVMSRGEENSETVYQACSISKAITALAVAKLVDQGILSYESKIVEFVPQPIVEAIVDDNTQHLMQHVTIGMLLSHRSGLSQHGFPGYVGEPAKYQDIVSGKPPSNTPRIRFLGFPGAQYIYSGGGFTLLQIALEHITWLSFAEFMSETVLEPLGMSRSRFGDPVSGDNNYARAHFTAYTPGTSTPRGYHRFTELAAAGLWTTPTDLLKAVSAIQRSLYSKTGFLTTRTARKMLTLVAPDDSSAMGMGWTMDQTFFGHSGDNDPGYSCYVMGGHRIHDLPVALNNPRLMSLAVMTNSALGWPTIKKLVAAIFAFRIFPLYPTLLKWSMSNFCPYPTILGANHGDRWKDYIGHWTSRRKLETALTPTSQQASRHGTPDTPTQIASLTIRDGEWEIFADEDQPMLAFNDIDHAMPLRPGAAPWFRQDGSVEMVFIIDGLELAVRMCSKTKLHSDHTLVGSLMQERSRPPLDDDLWIELVSDAVTILRRA